jgi:hypothetical protein
MAGHHQALPGYHCEHRQMNPDRTKRRERILELASALLWPSQAQNSSGVCGLPSALSLPFPYWIALSPRRRVKSGILHTLSRHHRTSELAAEDPTACEWWSEQPYAVLFCSVRSYPVSPVLLRRQQAVSARKAEAGGDVLWSGSYYHGSPG